MAAKESSVRGLGRFPPGPTMVTLSEIAPSMLLMNGMSVTEMPWKRDDARASNARRNICWRAWRWKSSSVCR